MRKGRAVLVLAALAVVAGGCGGSEGNEDAEAQAVISRLKSPKPGEILIQVKGRKSSPGRTRCAMAGTSCASSV
jgi:hypothetical protein